MVRPELLWPTEDMTFTKLCRDKPAQGRGRSLHLTLLDAVFPALVNSLSYQNGEISPCL